jgi:hypothetical protein
MLAANQHWRKVAFTESTVERGIEICKTILKGTFNLDAIRVKSLGRSKRAINIALRHDDKYHDEIVSAKLNLSTRAETF